MSAMASNENEIPQEIPDSAVLSAEDYERMEQTLKDMLEDPDQYAMDPNSFYPELYDPSYGVSNITEGEIDWTNYDLPMAEEEPEDSLFGDDEQPLQDSLLQDSMVLQPQPIPTHPNPAVLSLNHESVGPSVSSGKVPSKRTENIGKVNPANFYQPLPWVPISWPENQNTFQYNSFGELLPHLKYTPKQIMEFITDHPGNWFNGNYNGKTSALTLWIQTAPADSSRRYPNPASDKCRFACCPVTNNSIHKGTFRVAFDEWSSSGMQLDPFHCAGYVHLYCLEKYTPFSRICANYNVRADTREFPEGRNKMAITRDHEVFSRFVEKYVRIVSKPDFDHDREYDYKKTLCHKLVKTHIDMEPKVRQKVREERGGNSIDIHLGDLEVFAAGEVAKKAARDAKKPLKPVKTTTRKSKRNLDKEDSPDMDDMFGSTSTPRSPKRARR